MKKNYLDCCIEKIKTDLPNINIIYYRTIDSTQKKARELIENNVANGTVIITDNQTKGIGTHGREWYTSNKDNVLMTLIHYPNCDINKLETITTDIAKSIVDVIEAMYEIKLNIKKPNDIILNNKKIGGILVETISYASTVKTLLIGIGLNVNQTKFTNEIAEIATSLKKENNMEFQREELITNILKRIEKIMNKVY